MRSDVAQGSNHVSAFSDGRLDAADEND